MCNTYMYTELDTSKETFMEAIQKGNYVDNQCWLNTLTDYYKDTLMKNKKKEPMSRGMILKLINKTEQEFTESAASIDDMIPGIYEIQNASENNRPTGQNHLYLFTRDV